ncbi:hypothetical protein D3C73_1064810 [compost metagenome]
MLPEDHKLYSYYQDHQAQSIQINMAMWKMINLSSTFHKLQPELENRLKRSTFIADQELHIALQCKEDYIYLDYKQKQLSVSDTSNHTNAYTSIIVDERDLMTYIMFGYNEEAGASKDHAEHTDILLALFPKQQAVFYLTDKF